MTVEEMEETLERLGLEVISIRGSELQGYCPAHLQRTGHPDNNPSWWINAETGAHICFSCQFKGGLYSLVSYIQGIEYEDAKSWVDSSDRNLSAALAKATRPKEIFQEQTHITESMLSAFTDPPELALRSRGLSAKAAAYYEVLWDNNNSNWITVIRDPYTNKLMGWQEKGSVSRYFKNYPTGVQKSTALFGYQQYNGGDMVVVESPLDVVRLASVGVLGGVSTYGAVISMAQLNIIRGATRIIFALDNDEAGRSASLSMLDLCKKMGTEAWFFNYSKTDQKDVGGMSRDEILSGIETARHSIHGFKAVI